LGGINNVRLKLPDEGARVRFIEDIPQTFGGAPPITYKSKMCRFNTYGFNNSTAANSSERGGSIVRNLGIDASIPSNFSSMISIGAQPNGNQSSGNATSFSNYNTGIIDRVIPTKSLKTSETEPEDPLKTQFEQFKKTVEGLLSTGWWSESWIGKSLSTDGGLFTDVFRDRNWYGDDMSAFSSYGTAYHQLLNGIYSQEPSKGGSGKLNAPFFLPFNLNMDIDGMSGIVMMQRFEIDQKILPPSYDKDSVEIIVKSVDHEVTVSSWTTKLGTQSVPKIKIRKASPSQNTKGQSGSATSTNNRVNQAKRSRDRVNAKLRMQLTLVEDLEYATLAVIEILAADESTVLSTVAAMISPEMTGAGGGTGLYTGGDRFLCVQDVSELYGSTVVWLIGNSLNNYDFNQLSLNGGGVGVQTNVLIIPNTPNEFSNITGPKINVGDGFISAPPDSQVDSELTGVGKYGAKDLAARSQNQDAWNVAMSNLEGVENWYMDVIDITSNTNTGAQITQGGLSDREKARNQVTIFVRKLERVSPAAKALWFNNKGYDWEEAARLYRNDKEANKYVASTANKVSSGVYGGTMPSDIRLKTNIQPISGSLNKLEQLRPVEFDWLVDRDNHEYGFIAQEVEKVVPEIVSEHDAIGGTKEFLKNLDGTETFKTIEYSKLTVLLVDAMKEQQKQIEELKKEIGEIKNGLSQ